MTYANFGRQALGHEPQSQLPGGRNTYGGGTRGPHVDGRRAPRIISDDDLRAEAIEWQATRGARSGRVAWQYFTDLAGRRGVSL